MPFKLFELINIATKLATQLQRDVAQAEPLKEDVEQALSALKAAFSKTPDEGADPAAS